MLNLSSKFLIAFDVELKKIQTHEFEFPSGGNGCNDVVFRCHPHQWCLNCDVRDSNVQRLMGDLVYLWSDRIGF